MTEKIDELRQQAMTATQAAQAAKSAVSSRSKSRWSTNRTSDDVGSDARDGGRCAINERRNHQQKTKNPTRGLKGACLGKRLRQRKSVDDGW